MIYCIFIKLLIICWHNDLCENEHVLKIQKQKEVKLKTNIKKKKKVNINENFLFNIDFSKLFYQKIGFLLLGCVKSKDTTKPMNDRKKDLLFSASKGEETRDPSQSSVLGAGKLGSFQLRVHPYSWRGLSRGEFSIELGSRTTESNL